MIKKVVCFFILLLLAFTGISLPKTGSEYAEFQADSAAMENVRPDQQCFCLPDHTAEIMYNYQISVFDIPLLPRIEVNNPNSVPVSSTTVLLNRLLMKHRLVCQSTPKHPYSLELLPGEAHPGAAKVYYVYTLRRLII